LARIDASLLGDMNQRKSLIFSYITHSRAQSRCIVMRLESFSHIC